MYLFNMLAQEPSNTAGEGGVARRNRARRWKPGRRLVGDRCAQGDFCRATEATAERWPAGLQGTSSPASECVVYSRGFLPRIWCPPPGHFAIL